MSTVSDLIDFLVGLMRDEEAQTAFEQNPQHVLAHKGLGHVSGQDVRDARMIMQDGGGLRPAGHSGHSRPGSDDPVREIHHTTKHYQVDEHYQYVDQTFNLVNIDDRDTTVVDSFNSNDNNDTDVIAIQDNSRDTTIDIDDSFNDVPVPSPAEPAPSPEPEPVPVEDEPDSVVEEPIPPVDLSEPAPVPEEPEPDPDPVDAAVI